MQVFTFNCNSQRLRRYSSGVIYAGSYPNTVFRFNFNTSDWDSVTKTAVFSYRGKNYRVLLDENNMCKVPKEVLHEGYFLASVEGLAAPTNTVRIPVDAMPDGLQPETPDIDGDTSVPGVNILDGGAIIFEISDNTPDIPPEDDDSESSDESSVVGDIVKNNIPFYSGLSGDSLSQVAYKQLDANTADHTEQGFYTTSSGGKITSAGYQITFEENPENIAQTFAICSIAKIVAAYQYQPAFDQWLDMGFDGTYWVEDGTTTQIINGKQITYTTYAYNAELMGDAITSPEYWRFEVEVS